MKYELHSLSKSPAYRSWVAMKQRCLNPESTAYANYGGRGIVVCERWQKSFIAFLQDMGHRPEGFTLERIKNAGNYEPENCRWASHKEQMLNRRNTVEVTVEGITYKAVLLAEIAGMKTDTIVARAKQCDTLQELLDPKRRVFYEGLSMSPNFGKTHCKHGHEFTKENTYLYLGKYRQCITCSRTRTKRYRREAKE